MVCTCGHCLNGNGSVGGRGVANFRLRLHGTAISAFTGCGNWLSLTEALIYEEAQWTKVPLARGAHTRNRAIYPHDT